MNPTEKFRAALPYTLLAASPSFASLHAAKSSSRDALDGFCSYCGSYFTALNSTTRLRRINQRGRNGESERVKEVKCTTCSFTTKTLIKSNPTHETISKLPSTPEDTKPPTVVPLKAPPKSKAQLKQMLERARGHQANRDKNKNPTLDLESFLSGL